MDQNERRQYKRIFFSVEDGPKAAFYREGSAKDEFREVTVMDISVGGLGMCYNRNNGFNANVGDILILREINGLGSVKPMSNMNMEVRWRIDNENINHVLFGCQFVDISREEMDDVQEFIDAWTNK